MLIGLLYLHPALFDRLSGAGDCERVVGDILGHGRACRSVCVFADLNGSHKAGVASDKRAVLDCGAALLVAGVISRSAAAADVDSRAEIGVADIRKVGYLCICAYRAVLDFNEVADMDGTADNAAGTDADERTDVRAVEYLR